MTWLGSGSQVDELVVDGPNIEELDIETKEKPVLSSNLSEPFVDPAIVSYDRPEDTNLSSAKIPTTEFRPSPPTDYSSIALESKPADTIHTVRLETKTTLRTEVEESTVQQNKLDEAMASATLAEPFNDLSIQDPEDVKYEEYTNVSVDNLPRAGAMAPAGSPLPAHPTPKPAGRRNRTGNRRGKAALNGREASDKSHPQSRQADPSQSKKEGKTVKEWTQTSLRVATSRFDHLPSKAPSQPGVNTTKRKSRRQLKVSEDRNGWATGDASDIQDMGDFDFEGNLSKFDKRKVFEKIRQEDTTADEDRLVSFNRVQVRPGTNGGKNLHHSENVLDSPTTIGQLAWNNGDSEEEISDSKLSSRRSSRRNFSRRKAPSRKGSAIQAGDQHMTGSVPLPEQIAKARFSSNDQAGSPKVLSHPSGIPRFSSSLDHLKPSLRILPSNRICPSLSPLQMVELEQLATGELGLTEDMITENAARGIAETARKLVNVQPALNSTSDQTAPLIFIMAGNHRTGARAIAAGRHLRNHHTHVIVCVLGHEREEHLIDSVRRQLVVYRNCGGVTSKTEDLIHSLHHLQAPRSLIVDALLGIHTSFDDLRPDDQIAYSQLSKWANSVEFSALSIDIPSGLDPSSGEFFSRGFLSRSITHEYQRVANGRIRIGHSCRLYFVSGCSQGRSFDGTKPKPCV